jgi:hypothetical protein
MAAMVAETAQDRKALPRCSSAWFGSFERPAHHQQAREPRPGSAMTTARFGMAAPALTKRTNHVNKFGHVYRFAPPPLYGGYPTAGNSRLETQSNGEVYCTSSLALSLVTRSTPV